MNNNNTNIQTNNNVINTTYNYKQTKEVQSFDNSKKANRSKNIKIRVASSCIVVLYFFILFLFSSFATVWTPQIAIKYISLFYWLTLLLMVPLTTLIGMEVNNLFFKDKPQLSVLFIFLITIPIILPFIANYGYLLSGQNDKGSLEFIAASVMVIFILIDILVCCLGLKAKKALTAKNFFILFSIILICNFAGFGLLYFLYKSWTIAFYLLLIAIFMDSFSYLGGTSFGKTKMAPKVSPNKTWEGFGFAISITPFVMFLILYLFSFDKSYGSLFYFALNNRFLTNIDSLIKDGVWWAIMVIVTIACCLMSVAGDLAFSAMKRALKIKDFGNIIPGHGGILDRIDSHSFVIIFYLIVYLPLLYA